MSLKKIVNLFLLLATLLASFCPLPAMPWLRPVAAVPTLFNGEIL